MISHKHRCIYIHIPKVAGTSIMTFFGNPDKQRRLLDQKKKMLEKMERPPLPFDPNDENKFCPPSPHCRAVDYVKHRRVTQDQFDEYFKFSFVRNPWARLVSEYKYRLHAQHYDFKTFLYYKFPQPSWNDRYCHVLPQYDYLHDNEGKLMVDFVGRFENLQKDFEKVCQKIDIPPRPLPQTNKSLSLLQRRHDTGIVDMVNAFFSYFSLNQRRNTHPHYRDYYDDDTRDYVAELYQKDVETFGYKF